MTILAVGNGKGGVGKTTIGLQYGLYLVEEGNKVLYIDIDGQEDLSVLIGHVKSDGDFTSDMLFKLGCEPKVNPVTKWVCRSSEVANKLFYIPGNHHNLGEVGASTDFSLMTAFKENVQKLEKDYDYIIIDTPPSLGMCQLAALNTSDVGIIPIIADADACGEEKMSKYLSLYKTIMKRNERLKFPVVVLNLVDAQSLVVKRYIDWARKFFGQSLVDNRFDRSAAILNSNSAKRAVWFKPASGNDRAKGAAYRRAVARLDMGVKKSMKGKK